MESLEFKRLTVVENKKKYWLYYDMFQYKAKFEVPNAILYKNTSTRYINETLAKQKKITSYTEILKENLKFKNIVDQFKSEIKLLTHHNCVTVYANSLKILYTFAEIMEQNTIVETVTLLQSRPKAVMYQINPKHKYRIYMKNRVYTNQDINNMFEFLKQYEHIFFPSPNFSFFLHHLYKRGHNSRYGDNSFFVDFDDESASTIFYINYHEFIGKEYEIKKPELAA